MTGNFRFAGWTGPLFMTVYLGLTGDRNRLELGNPRRLSWGAGNLSGKICQCYRATIADRARRYLSLLLS